METQRCHILMLGLTYMVVRQQQFYISESQEITQYNATAGMQQNFFVLLIKITQAVQITHYVFVAEYSNEQFTAPNHYKNILFLFNISSVEKILITDIK